MKRICTSLCVFFVLSSCVCPFVIFKLNKARIQSRELADSYFVDSELYNLLIWNIGKHYSFENSAITDFEITDKDNNKLLFSDLMENESGEYKLVFFFSSTHCGSCIDSEMSNIQSFGHIVGKNHIIILAQYESMRHLRAFLASRKINIPVYCVKTNPVGILKEENLPYSFIVDKNMTAEFVFIPIKEIPSYSEMYYTTIRERFFHKGL